MKHIDEYRDKQLISTLLQKINRTIHQEVSLMEVCGGHTWAIQKFGIPSMLPDKLQLLSGPGCPVCVTSKQFIDQAVAFSRMDDVIITTFGDLVRVPGSSSNLYQEKSKGADIRMVYSVHDALDIAKQSPEKKVIFLGIGFETTAPGTAAGIQTAAERGLQNFYVLSSHKVMPPAMAALIDEGVQIDGYLAPGHVSAITGSGIYQEIPRQYGVGCVISGFEPADILQSIFMLLEQINSRSFKVEIQYKRAVKPEGNQLAKRMMNEVFSLRDDWWRGFGVLPLSGLRINEAYERFDADKMIPVEIEKTADEKGCICGDILKGLKKPNDCRLFGKQCNTTNPVGACMVSHEGACNAYYRFNT